MQEETVKVQGKVVAAPRQPQRRKGFCAEPECGKRKMLLKGKNGLWICIKCYKKVEKNGNKKR